MHHDHLVSLPAEHLVGGGGGGGGGSQGLGQRFEWGGWGSFPGFAKCCVWGLEHVE